MTGPLRGALIAALGALVLSACGATYVETSVTTAPGGVSTTTLAEVDPNAPLPELLDEIGDLLRHLDERVVAGDDPGAALGRLEELWDVTEPQIRATALDSIYDFEQALTYARLGVNRKRPADASKAYRVWVDIVAAFDH